MRRIPPNLFLPSFISMTLSHKTITGILIEARKLEQQADERKAESGRLVGAARLEDINLWQMAKEKTTKKGSKTYGYWMASWREGGKVRNVHLGSCRKVDHKTALQKARKLKAEALGLSENQSAHFNNFYNAF